jgi:hypothetical protein
VGGLSDKSVKIVTFSGYLGCFECLVDLARLFQEAVAKRN